MGERREYEQDSLLKGLDSGIHSRNSSIRGIRVENPPSGEARESTLRAPCLFGSLLFSALLYNWFGE
jgi:hypothetical protein